MILHIHAYEELIYKFNAAVDGLDGWKDNLNNNIVFQSGDVMLYGGNSPKFSILFSRLSPHYQVKIEMEFWNNLMSFGGLQMYLDGMKIYNRSYNNDTIISLNGPTPFNQYYDIIKVKYPQKKKTAFIYIDVTGLSSCGIRIFYFYIERCPQECDVCDNYDFLACKKWRIFMLNFDQYQFSNLQGWSTELSWNLQSFFICGQCHFLRQYQIQYTGVLPPHKGLMVKFFRIFDIGSQIILINGVEYLVQQPTVFYQIELIIHQHIDQKLSIYIQLGYIRDFELYYQIEEKNSDLQIINCLYFIDTICVSCLDGWEFDEIQNQCQPQCGDHLIQGLEECDDGNQIQNDGCYQCKFDCGVHCLNCEFGICKKCDSGYLVQSNQNNNSQCYLEIHDEEEEEEEQSEEESQFLDNCIVLEEQLCKQCLAGYLLQNGYCFPYCGDGILIIGLEECDDGNLVPYDGCFNCAYQCPLNCILCNQGVCYQQCEIGFEFIDQSCLPICGDGLITYLEECDDQNQILYDGCYECQFSCPQNCLECLDGNCLQCNINYQLQSNNICKLIIEQQKECDDQNYDSFDGCHQFQIQIDWVCRRLNQDTFSECSYFKYPQLYIHYEYMSRNIQYLKLTFNQPVKVQPTRLLIESLTFSILNLSESQYNINVLNNQDISRYLKIVEYYLEIEIFQLLTFKPILIINLQQNITNQYGQKIQAKKYSKSLQFSTYLDENQRYYSQIAQQTNRYILFSFGGACALFIFQGRYEQLIEIINLLSFQNYLRYINVRFPQNLLLYFESYDLLSLKTIISLLNIQQIERFVFYKEYKETSGKFKFYEENADLITNLEWQIIQSLLYVLLILLSTGIQKFIQSHYFNNKVLQYISLSQQHSNREYKYKCIQWLYNRSLWVIHLGKVLSLNGIQGVLLVNGWDLIFKGMLYLKYLQVYTIKDFFSLILALIILLFYLIYILNSRILKSQYNSIIQARKLKKKRFKVFQTLIQFCFIACLIFLESSEILQLGVIALINLIQLNLSYKYLKGREKFYSQMVIQSSVLIFTLSSYIYIQEVDQYLYEEFKIKCGWFHILILSFGVLIEILSIIAQQIKYYIRQYKRKRNLISQDELIINQKEKQKMFILSSFSLFYLYLIRVLYNNFQFSKLLFENSQNFIKVILYLQVLYFFKDKKFQKYSILKIFMFSYHKINKSTILYTQLVWKPLIYMKNLFQYKTTFHSKLIIIL